MKDLVVFVPSRNRPHNILELVQTFEETETVADLVVVLDDDEKFAKEYAELARVITVPKTRRGMARPLNIAASQLKNDYKNFAFLGDDHRPRTKNWDRIFVAALSGLGTGLVYGDDLLQRQNLPTAVAMTQDIVIALDGMVPPNMIHLYLDNFWLQLGRDLDAIRYIPEVVLEHMHPLAGKAEWDSGYVEVNAQEIYSEDEKSFREYMASKNYAALLEQLRK